MSQSQPKVSRIDLGQMYRIMVAYPLRNAPDRIYATRSTKQMARDLARQLNAASVKRHGERGPLYYVERNSAYGDDDE